MNTIFIDREKNVIKFPINNNIFRIMQVTDMHLHHLLPYSKEIKDLRWVSEISQEKKADLVINTGDLFCFNAKFLVKRILKKFDSVVGSKIPWTFAWGNHDNENFRPNSLKRLRKLEEYIENLPNILYINNHEFISNVDPTPPEEGSREYLAQILPLMGDNAFSMKNYDGTIGGNFAIELTQEENKEQKVKLILFILNSRRNYGVPENARKWMKNYIKSFKQAPPAFAFYHVPNIEFHKIWDEGNAIGFKRESVCFEKEEGTLHSFFKELGNIKACFVGHDHVNDYYGIYDGILYSYGRKTARSGYGPDRKTKLPVESTSPKKVVDGLKQITIDFTKNTWSFNSLLINGTKELKYKTRLT